MNKENKIHVPKFECENEFVRTDRERQDSFMLNDGAVWHLFQYICIEEGAYSPGFVNMPDMIYLNLGAGKSAEIQGRSILRVLYAFQQRFIVSLEPGDCNAFMIQNIEICHK